MVLKCQADSAEKLDLIANEIANDPVLNPEGYPADVIADELSSQHTLNAENSWGADHIDLTTPNPNPQSLGNGFKDPGYSGFSATQI